ncbi:MAG: UDP-N-acetylglucosamine 1-carboxyvinyltransferase [Proteobacteria bacterium]|nr:UDP-N-acetylglucosamine 1-carboxyvinyltransferase [Pseudomonadota bacterium]MBU4067672.1 UDP-N-acetylglucosamine 1-carboxyvinyltransferase [Pseudomonadota bacterium]MBU4101281.1 UDP-N-acetylglucosamine 1-carboxyvinyltransferase [Pseudomonadota bacterium]MBU4127881.1 UDP-N-acetylglucosamine 1-carboxyvinyltransferase [Pseudomonadota bacterium]MCG2831104.1 UDP-N-acetylglucosamine 1-carboxyvinyltransferase [Desulfobacteraceae bacterium]
MDKIIVEGGRPLMGEVSISGAKNAALPILVSSLLTDGLCTFSNVPNLKDIESIKLLLSHLGAKIETDGDVVKIDAGNILNHEAPYDLVRKMRASILVLGPLVARLKKARVSLPGGCAIGARPINLHLKALACLGASIELKHGYVEAYADKLEGSEIYLDIATVTGTENIMMTAVLAEGRTVIHNAAREPEIVALSDVLNKMGADIRGAGTSTITIIGVSSLNPVSVSIIPDRIETGTFMIAAALTGGDIKISGCEPGHLEAVIHKLGLTGTIIKIDGKNIRVQGIDDIASVDLKTLPYPGFPTDMQAQFMVLMSVAGGLSLISETVFENRFIHVSELKRMGADITIAGNSAMVKGVKMLSGAPVMATDLRASASLILAGLVARGKTEVNRIYHLDRGYESLEKKFASLGAAIKRVKE